MSQPRETFEPVRLTRSETARFYARKLQRHPAFARSKKVARAVRRFVPSAWRMATQGYRQLPSVVVVGAQKAGTTQLYAYLTQHRQLLPASHKELNYFSLHPDRPAAWYRAQFPFQSRVAAVNGQAIEASPSYLPSPAALRRLHALLPEAKILCVLRDPVSRAFSHYQHAKTRGRESRSFAQAVQEELHEDPPSLQSGVALQEDAVPQTGYVARGYYALQLELVMALYPKEQVLVLDSADLFRDTSEACCRVFEFLGLERFDVQPGKVFNRGYYKERIDPQVAERLRAHYRPLDALLAQLMGRPFAWMDSARPLAA